MKTLELTQGKVALVDDEDFERLSQHKWYAHRTPTRAACHRYQAVRMSPRTGGHQSMILMSRAIMGAEPGQYVDHIDGDPLNNRRTNLRFVTRAENAQNVSRMRQNNTSGYRGVSRNRDKWRACIQVNGQVICLGSFVTAAEAAAHYDLASTKYHGEYGHRNFPVKSPKNNGCNHVE